MNILFAECLKPSPIRVKLALPFAFLSISSYVKARDQGFSFRFHSYQLDHLTSRRSVNIDSLVRFHEADVVMAGACTSTFPRTARLLEQAKAAGCHTVLGGLYPTYNARGVLASHPDIDFVVVGDGERPSRDLLNALREGRPTDDIPGIGFRRGETVVVNPPPCDPPPLPLLDLTPLEVEQYHSVYQRHYLFGGRGCQHRCSFCTVRRDGRVSLRRIEDVLQDARVLFASFGAQVASLCDANISSHKAQYRDLLTALRADLPGFPVSVKGRIDEIDDEYVGFLKDANVSSLAVGWETPVFEQLQSVRKTTQGLMWPERTRGLLRRAQSVGLEVHVNVMLGMPGESEGSLASKVDQVARLYRQFGIRPFLSFFTPHPGTPAHAALDRYRLRVVERNLENFDHLHPVVVPSGEEDDFVEKMWAAYSAISALTRSEEMNPPRAILETLNGAGDVIESESGGRHAVAS